jgi:hypothetical protein
MRHLRSSLWIALALLLAAGPAAATSVLHTVDASLSMLSADVSGTLAITVNTNLGSVGGSAVANGTLNSNTESGTVQLDWGAPSWNSQLDVGAGDADLHTGPSGSVNGNATLNLFGFLPVNFSLTIAVDDITLNLATPFSSPTFPLDPGGAGPGPWGAADIVDLMLGAQVDFSAVGPFGITIGNNNVPIGPSVVPTIPIPLNLARVGGYPGTGSAVTLTIPPGMSLSLPAQPPSSFPSPGCEFGQTTFGCTLDVSSVTVQLTSLTFSNIAGTLVATSNTIVPEPTVGLLLGVGLAGLAARRHRRAD